MCIILGLKIDKYKVPHKFYFVLKYLKNNIYRKFAKMNYISVRNVNLDKSL